MKTIPKPENYEAVALTDLFPFTEEFLIKSKEGKYNIDLSNQKYLIKKICAFTTLNDEKAEMVLQVLFQFVRSQLLNGYSLRLPKFGKLYVFRQKNDKLKLGVRVKREILHRRYNEELKRVNYKNLWERKLKILKRRTKQYWKWREWRISQGTWTDPVAYRVKNILAKYDAKYPWVIENINRKKAEEKALFEKEHPELVIPEEVKPDNELEDSEKDFEYAF